ncbi:hypothetical protein [Paenibacillus soyae]|uniref:Intracellular proteinase inhibitor BsuPI domain-containing protein n=1 Tax=Paenibacillus soyae TaxID=2969249 RepID=A0A9X2MTY1_9BACL|nr:hypothetical protein [Paenibacillus soyae]MCR2805803.1 hypothetical protein [Paenibacillus soyae]
MSRRLPRLLAAAMLIILLSACGSDKTEEPMGTMPPALAEKMAEPKLVHKDDLFEMKLNIGRTEFKTGEPIELSASLTYIGEEESITVWGPGTRVVFAITDGKDFDMDGATTLELASHELARGETFEYPFEKSGGFGADDPDAAFWKKFYAEKELRLPAGTYLISAVCNFSLTEEVVDSDYRGEVYTTVTVTE